MEKTRKEKIDYLNGVYGYKLKTGIQKRGGVLQFYTLIGAEKYNCFRKKRCKTKLEFSTMEEIDKYLSDLILDNEGISTLKEKGYRLQRSDKDYLK